MKALAAPKASVPSLRNHEQHYSVSPFMTADKQPDTRTVFGCVKQKNYNENINVEMLRPLLLHCGLW